MRLKIFDKPKPIGESMAAVVRLEPMEENKPGIVRAELVVPVQDLDYYQPGAEFELKPLTESR